MIKLPLTQTDLQLDGFFHTLRHLELLMDNLSGAGRNLVIIKRREDVLGIPPVNALAVAIEHQHVDEMRPFIYFSRLARSTERAAAADDPAAGAGGEIDPD